MIDYSFDPLHKDHETFNMLPIHFCLTQFVHNQHSMNSRLSIIESQSFTRMNMNQSDHEKQAACFQWIVDNSFGNLDKCVKYKEEFNGCYPVIQAIINGTSFSVTKQLLASSQRLADELFYFNNPAMKSLNGLNMWFIACILDRDLDILFSLLKLNPSFLLTH